jgi:hypothetical protein
VRPGPGQALPWSTPTIVEVTDPVLVRQIHAECAGAEKRTARSPHGIPMIWYEVTGGAAEGAVDLPGKFPWPTPKTLQPFVTREEMEAFWALPPVVR